MGTWKKRAMYQGQAAEMDRGRATAINMAIQYFDDHSERLEYGLVLLRGPVGTRLVGQLSFIFSRTSSLI